MVKMNKPSPGLPGVYKHCRAGGRGPRPMKQGTETYVNIVPDMPGTWEDMPMGCHDYSKNSRNFQPTPGSTSTLTSHSPCPLYHEVGGDFDRHPPEALLPEELLVVPRGCHSQIPAATPPSASAWPSAWLPAGTNGKKN